MLHGRPGSAHVKSRPPEAGRQAQTHIDRGDSLRNQNNSGDAAESYQAALELAPERTDIRVQLGNMLKDAGRYSEAEATYRRAILEDPDNADIRLQLGHALKLQGRRVESLGEYRRAVELDQYSTQAVAELAMAGAPDAQQLLHEIRWRAGGTDAFLTVIGELADMRRRLDQIMAALPAMQSWTAFPIALYKQFRDVYDVPRAPLGRPADCTVLLLADSEPLEILYAQLTGLRAQSHPHWRLIAVGADAARRQVIERAAAADPRIGWVDLAATETPAAAELRLAGMATTEWCLLLANGAVLHRHALGWIVAAGEWGEVAAFICDEAVGHPMWGGMEYTSPVLRQVVDYDTLLEANVFGATIALRKGRAAEMSPSLTNSLTAARSFLLLHLAHAQGVGHIPLPLVWRAEQPDDPLQAAAHFEAVSAHLAAAQSAARIELPPGAAVPAILPIAWQPVHPDEAIGVIIPTRDNIADIQTMISSLIDTANIPDALHILIIDNGSQEAVRKRLEDLAEAGKIKLLTNNEPFNWSRLNNQAVAALDTPLLVFANDDMQMLTPGWDERLRGLLARPDIGAVGARLLYPDGTIQHAGILFGWRGSPTHHDGVFEPAVAAGPASRWQVSRSVSAVTGAFLATRRDRFVGIGGFDEAELAVSYSDIDFALRLRSSGAKILWCPRITLSHHESKTRGLDHLQAEKAARNAAEQGIMQSRWGAALQRDPGVNPAWYPASLPFRLIAPPSEQRLRQHIRDCASRQPWLASIREQAEC